MNRIIFYLTLISVFVVSGCQSYKNVPYLQNSQDVDLTQIPSLYDAKIMPKDILTITVTSPLAPEAVAMYNLTVQSSNTTNSSARNNFSTQVSLIPYLVSNEGTITFPVLGEIHVVGMTKTDLENYILDKIMQNGMKEKPIVTVTMSNYKIAVLGEVARSGVYTASNGKINVFEALAMAGDMTIHGRRDSVKVVREDVTGKKTISILNLNDANVVMSPYYQLQQNDIVYVTPNKVKAKNSGIGSETSLWFTSTSILVSLASLIYNILK